MKKRKWRFKEDELRDSERSEFLKLKAKADLDPGKPAPVPRPVKRDKAVPSKLQTKLFPAVVKVKATDSKKQILPTPVGAESQPSKKPRLKESDQVGGVDVVGGGSTKVDEDSGGLAGLLGGYGSDEEA
eukprot:jgi/Botrbrau1/16841/Bobra.150_2s0065.2